MNEAIPPKPIGSSPKWFFMRRVWDYVFGGKFPLKGVRGIVVKWVEGQYEISKEDNPGIVSAPAAPGGGMNWRGEYTQSPASAYQIYDVVKITTGTAAGVYIAVVASPDDDPDTGIGWVQIAPGNSSGDWN